MLTLQLSPTLIPTLPKDTTFFINPAYVVIRYKLDSQYVQTSINRDAFEILNLCRGDLQIDQVIQTVLSNNRVNDGPPTNYRVLEDFLKDCNECGLLTFASEPTRSVPKILGSFDVFYPRHLSIELTHTCNLHCQFCYHESFQRQIKNFIPAEKLIASLSKLKENGLEAIELTGGEVLLHPDFWSILDFACSEFDTIAVITNGTLITPEIAQRFSRYHDQILFGISLDSFDPTTHDTLRGSKGAHEKAVNGIMNLSKHNMRVRASMVYTPQTYNHIYPTMLFAKKIKATYFGFSPVLPFGCGSTMCGWNDISDEEKRKLGEDVLRILEEEKQFVPTPNPADLPDSLNCGAGYRSFAVSPEGNIRPCLLYSKEHGSLGNIFSEGLEIVFSNPICQSLYECPSPNDQSCSECRERLFCKPCILRGVKNYKEKVGDNCRWYQENRHIVEQLVEMVD